MRRAMGALAILTSLAWLAEPARGGVPYLSLSLQDSESFDRSEIDGDGGGGELTVGYFFTRQWAIELAGMISDFENDFIDGTLAGASVNLRFSPLPNERLQPFLKAGVGAYFLEEDGFDGGIAGPGANLGLGADLFLVPGFSIGAEATWRFITYTDEYVDDCCGEPVYFDLEDDLDGRTFSAGVTFTYHFR